MALPCRGGTLVRFDTVEGIIDVQLFDDAMPVTVANFLNYVNTDRYDGTVVHRAADSGGTDFVVQGGGFSLFDPVPPATRITFGNVVTDPPIADEPGGGVAGPSNLRGTIAMAKSGPNTVTSQWFFNQDDNSSLDNPLRPDGGFSAFGMVLGDGMTVVDAIGDLPLPPDFGFGIASPFGELPLRNFSGSSIDDIRVANTVTVNSISVLNVPQGDFDLDGDVDLSDLAILQRGFGTASGAFLDDGDADMDGDVDADDLQLWETGFGTVAAVASLPEPTACLLLLFGLGTACTSRRR